MPFLAKVPEKQIPFSKRKYAFLFPATYIPLSYLEDQIKEQNASDLLIAKEILSLCIQGSREDFENLYQSLAKEDKKEMDSIMTSELIYGVTGSFLTDVSFDFYKKKEKSIAIYHKYFAAGGGKDVELFNAEDNAPGAGTL